MALYHIGIWFYTLGIYLASFHSEKAKAWIAGRRNWRNSMPEPKMRKRFWFHCASLGEFEQARPLIEHYHKQGIEICLSFFSPSGYASKKNYTLAAWVGYLPMDGRRVAKDFVRAMDADRIFFVKYEFWYFFLKEIKSHHIPFYLISARFRPSQPFFRWYGSLHRSMLQAYTRIFTQDQASLDLLQGIGVNQVHYAGDTRFDRVLQLPQQKKELPLIEAFCKGHLSLVAGSCWPPEEALIKKAMPDFPEMRWVLVPHDIGEDHLKGIEDRFKGVSIRYTSLERGQDSATKKVLIVDKIGLLGQIYPYGQMALIGGGFSNALHNILEAAVWGVPVMYGNKIGKYPEGRELAEAGGGFMLEHSDHLSGWLHEWQDETIRNSHGALAGRWVERNRGATERILAHIDPLP